MLLVNIQNFSIDAEKLYSSLGDRGLIANVDLVVLQRNGRDSSTDSFNELSQGKNR